MKLTLDSQNQISCLCSFHGTSFSGNPFRPPNLPSTHDTPSNSVSPFSPKKGSKTLRNLPLDPTHNKIHGSHVLLEGEITYLPSTYSEYRFSGLHNVTLKSPFYSYIMKFTPRGLRELIRIQIWILQTPNSVLFNSCFPRIAKKFHLLRQSQVTKWLPGVLWWEGL